MECDLVFRQSVVGFTSSFVQQWDKNDLWLQFHIQIGFPRIESIYNVPSFIIKSIYSFFRWAQGSDPTKSCYWHLSNEYLDEFELRDTFILLWNQFLVAKRVATRTYQLVHIQQLLSLFFLSIFALLKIYIQLKFCR